MIRLGLGLGTRLGLGLRLRRDTLGLDALRLDTLGLGGLCALAFLAGQLWVWQVLTASGYGVAANPANSFFYLLTGLHGLHLLGGLVAWAGTWAGELRGGPTPRANTGRQLHVLLLARYWHFLLALWLLLFALLASPPESLAALAELCGLR